MENKEKGLFTGFCSVFSFTAEQNMKGKGFKISSILIGLLVLAVCAAIPIIMAVSQQPEDSGDDEYNIIENMGGEDIDEDEIMNAIVVVNDAGIDENILNNFIALCGFEDMETEYSDRNVDGEYREFSEYCTGKYERPIGIYIHMQDDTLKFSYYIFEGTGVSRDYVDGFAQSFGMFYNDMKYLDADVPEEDIEILNLPVWTNVTTADGEDREMGVIIAQMIVPAIFSLLLFMMTILYGQSITKIVMSEKSSKLMEVLLTSVRPYALIAGKIAAMAVIAIVQVAVWAVLGIAGFVIGDKIGTGIYPDYINYIELIIDLIRESGTGFSLQAVILAVLMTVVGFFMYCVWAGFIASVVDKVDDVSTAMTMFQIPVMAGFFVSYLGSLLEMDTLISVCEYIPVVSPFVMPADVLMGKASFAGGVVSFLILVVFTLAMVLLTGKIYKGKVFNRK